MRTVRRVSAVSLRIGTTSPVSKRRIEVGRKRGLCRAQREASLPLNEMDRELTRRRNEFACCATERPRENLPET